MACNTLHGSLVLPFPSTTCRTLAAISAVKNGGFERRSRIAVRSTKKIAAAAALSSPAGDLRPELDENPEGIISGEWPENFSLLSYDDLRVYLETQIITDDRMKPTALLGDVMSSPVRAVTAEQTLGEIEHHFQKVSGLPVVDGKLNCIGVISKSDMVKASDGLRSKVGDVMSSPAISLSPDKAVVDAAALMLKMKIHRIPIVNDQGQVVGIVTRTDVFQALETLEV